MGKKTGDHITRVQWWVSYNVEKTNYGLGRLGKLLDFAVTCLFLFGLQTFKAHLNNA